jgi:histidine kinase
MEPVVVRGVCDDVTRELMYLFKFNRRELFVKYSNRSRLVTANAELLRSVVYNFLLNAVHYSGEGARAELNVSETRGKIKIAIRDYGPMLPSDVWREMKRGWVEKPTSVAMRPGSSGLGLYIASKFSRYMHADVGAVRHRDGTSFYVSLPVSKQATLWEM